MRNCVFRLQFSTRAGETVPRTRNPAPRPPLIDALSPNGEAPFSVEAFSCHKAGNPRTEYEDAWAIRGSDSPTRCRVAVADGATESSFSALWAALLVESFVRGRSSGPDFFEGLDSIRRLWKRKIRGRPLPWYAAEKAR